VQPRLLRPGSRSLPSRASARSTRTCRVLADAGIGLSRKGFGYIARQLSTLRIPVRVVYDARDRVLPDVADTVSRVKAYLPQARSRCWRSAGTSSRKRPPPKRAPCRRASSLRDPAA
jgi:hypothetical protein